MILPPNQETLDWHILWFKLGSPRSRSWDKVVKASNPFWKGTPGSAPQGVGEQKGNGRKQVTEAFLSCKVWQWPGLIPSGPLRGYMCTTGLGLVHLKVRTLERRSPIVSQSVVKGCSKGPWLPSAFGLFWPQTLQQPESPSCTNLQIFAVENLLATGCLGHSDGQKHWWLSADPCV